LWKSGERKSAVWGVSRLPPGRIVSAEAFFESGGPRARAAARSPTVRASSSSVARSHQRRVDLSVQRVHRRAKALTGPSRCWPRGAQMPKATWGPEGLRSSALAHAGRVLDHCAWQRAALDHRSNGSAAGSQRQAGSAPPSHDQSRGPRGNQRHLRSRQKEMREAPRVPKMGLCAFAQESWWRRVTAIGVWSPLGPLEGQAPRLSPRKLPGFVGVRIPRE
jgi:hypothetical protein